MKRIVPKLFNTAGPCNPADHYMLPALPRLPAVQGLVDREQYFVLHAPRQSGKTTVMMAFVKELNESGSYYALYCTLEELRLVTDEDKAARMIIGLLYQSLEISSVLALKKASEEDFLAEFMTNPAFIGSPIKTCLRVLSDILDKDLIIFVTIQVVSVGHEGGPTVGPEVPRSGPEGYPRSAPNGDLRSAPEGVPPIGS
jgi:hypothetical protein